MISKSLSLTKLPPPPTPLLCLCGHFNVTEYTDEIFNMVYNLGFSFFWSFDILRTAQDVPLGVKRDWSPTVLSDIEISGITFYCLLSVATKLRSFKYPVVLLTCGSPLELVCLLHFPTHAHLNTIIQSVMFWKEKRTVLNHQCLQDPTYERYVWIMVTIYSDGRLHGTPWKDLGPGSLEGSRTWFTGRI